MSLDCVTDTGKSWIEKQQRLIQFIGKQWGVWYVHPPLEAPATVDVLFHRKGTLVSVAEIKCRSLSVDLLRLYGQYLISEDKIVAGCEMAGQLGVPFFLFVGLVPDNRIVYWRISDGRGRRLLNYTTRKTETKRTCNDARTVVRENAYLPLTEMREFIAKDGEKWLSQ